MWGRCEGRPCSCLLGVGGDLDGELNALLQGVPGPLVHRFHRLDVHAADHKVVLLEAEAGTDRQLLVEAEHGRADDPVGVLQDAAGEGSAVSVSLNLQLLSRRWRCSNLVKVIKLHGGDGAADPGGDGFTGVAHKVRNREQSRRVSGVLTGLHLKVPEEEREQRTRHHHLSELALALA